MHNFKDFDIKPKDNDFTGDKIKVKNLFNLPIKVLKFKVEPSKQKDGADYLTLQIEKSGEKRIVFTGSKILMDQIKRVPEDRFPFTATIKGDNDRYEFT